MVSLLWTYLQLIKHSTANETSVIDYDQNTERKRKETKERKGNWTLYGKKKKNQVFFFLQIYTSYISKSVWNYIIKWQVPQ